MEPSLRILYFCEHTLEASSRSGIQRVVLELLAALHPLVELRPVTWDWLDGQLRFLDLVELRRLTDDEALSRRLLDPACRRANHRFGDSAVVSGRDTWLLFPEIPYHRPRGNEHFARILAQCREYGIRTAAIVYDLIPLLDDDYAEVRGLHAEYFANLLRTDLLLPISRYSAKEFFDYALSSALHDGMFLRRLGSRIRPVPLGEFRDSAPHAATRVNPSDPNRDRRMLMLGTVEPRKQQVRTLRAINDSRERHPKLATLLIDVVGSLHPQSAEGLHSELAHNPNIRFHHYASEAAVEALFSAADFSCFPSRHEGYGLPIVESLHRGVPCITANFGAMGEVAQGGGCLAVDVCDDDALVAAVAKCASDDSLLAALRGEIAARAARSWSDYAQEILHAMREASGASDLLCPLFTDVWRRTFSGDGDHNEMSATVHGVSWSLVAPRGRDPGRDESATGDDGASGLHAVACMISPVAWVGEAQAVAHPATHCDVLMIPEGRTIDDVVARVNEAAIDRPLPSRIFAGPDCSERGLEAALELSCGRQRALQAAEEENAFGTYMRTVRHSLPPTPKVLAVVISTYNRGAFVALNVAWILRQIDEGRLPALCVVVDNCSTDDTYARLSGFIGHPAFHYHCNSANTGMLGNLRVCSALDAARHVWVIGDDDFIVPGALTRTLELLREDPGVPLAFHNFAVYHRERISESDSPERFLAEQAPLSANPAATGRRRVNEIAAQHDNLFTAIYPIVFRSDILAACFNHPFDGVPFKDLVESVPTTRIILETYRYTEAHWFAEIGIVGNAHNSWAAHRPRWHLVLMPMVFGLARDAGVDATRLWHWTTAHKSLFDEACAIAVARGLPARLSIPGDLTNAHRVFRQPVELPSGLNVVPTPSAPLWQPAATGPGA